MTKIKQLPGAEPPPGVERSGVRKVVEAAENDAHTKLWQAINRYAAACGGSPSVPSAYGDVSRQRAVQDVEHWLSELIERH